MYQKKKMISNQLNLQDNSRSIVTSVKQDLELMRLIRIIRKENMSNQKIDYKLSQKQSSTVMNVQKNSQR